MRKCGSSFKIEKHVLFYSVLSKQKLLFYLSLNTFFTQLSSYQYNHRLIWYLFLHFVSKTKIKNLPELDHNNYTIGSIHQNFFACWCYNNPIDHYNPKISTRTCYHEDRQQRTKEGWERSTKDVHLFLSSLLRYDKRRYFRRTLTELHFGDRIWKASAFTVMCFWTKLLNRHT